MHNFALLTVCVCARARAHTISKLQQVSGVRITEVFLPLTWKERRGFVAQLGSALTQQCRDSGARGARPLEDKSRYSRIPHILGFPFPGGTAPLLRAPLTKGRFSPAF